MPLPQHHLPFNVTLGVGLPFRLLLRERYSTSNLSHEVNSNLKREGLIELPGSEGTIFLS